MKNIIGIVGTNSDLSTNRKLLTFIKNHFKEDANIELIEIKDLPLFNKPAKKIIPDRIKEISDKIKKADGVIISTPEYDHSITASLSSALAWLSYGIYPFVNKPVMITGASYGTLGSSRAQQHLRQILDSPELKARIMPSSEFLLGHSLEAFDDSGNLKNKANISKLEDLFKDFLTFIEIMKQLSNSYESNKREAENFDWENI